MSNKKQATVRELNEQDVCEITVPIKITSKVALERNIINGTTNGVNPINTVAFMVDQGPLEGRKGFFLANSNARVTRVFKYKQPTVWSKVWDFVKKWW